jgi:hypothetical protein
VTKSQVRVLKKERRKKVSEASELEFITLGKMKQKHCDSDFEGSPC